MNHFDSRQELEKWLIASGINPSEWGTGGAKTVANLWQEYEKGEITFRDEPPTRVVRVVRLILRRDEQILVEIAQEFSDGRLRQREQPPSEKVIAAESQFAAADRCLREELGLDPRQVQILNSTVEAKVKLDESPSYPGLWTHYTIYTVEARAEGLPGGDFWRENEAAGEGDPVRRHLWGWR